jgi:hypothetical protein
MKDSRSVGNSRPRSAATDQKPIGDDYQVIEVHVADLRHFFNSMDPSPFREKDLDPKAEEFIVDWAKTFPKNAKPSLLIHVDRGIDLQDEAVVCEAIRTYFGHRAAASRRRLRQLLLVGRTSLFIGSTVLVTLFLASNFVARNLSGISFGRLLQEGLVIGGWVAMWRPMEIFLYDWWPIQSEAKLFDRLSSMPVRIAYTGAAHPPDHI